MKKPIFPWKPVGCINGIHETGGLTALPEGDLGISGQVLGIGGLLSRSIETI